MGNRIIIPSESVVSVNNFEQDYQFDATGNVLVGYEIPDEILITIFEHVPSKCLVSVIPLVCQHWNSVSHSWHFWKSRILAQNIKISKSRLDRICANWGNPGVLKGVQQLCVFQHRKAFNHNLLKNPSGVGKRRNTIITGLPKTKLINDRGKNLNPLQYQALSRMQEVKLKEFGVGVALLDLLKPSLCISEWVSDRSDCGSKSSIKVELIGSGGKKEFQMDWSDVEIDRCKWHQMKKLLSYDEMGVGVKTLRFTNTSRDTQFWADHYGAKTAGASLVLDIQNDFEQKN